MRRGIVVGVLSLFTAAVMMTGCGSSKSSSDTGYYTEEATAAEEPMNYAAEDMYVDDYAMTEESADAAATGSEGTESVTVADNRKLIRNVDMSVETEDLNEMLTNINQRISEFGGYAEYSTIESGYANIKARIPSANLDAFVSHVSEISNVTSKTESAEDITLQYVDTKSRVESLRVEQDRLNELLAEADNIETVIALENRLSEVRYELQSYESQLRTYDNLVDYSTVQIYVNQVTTYTPPEEASRWERMTTGFVDSLYGVAEGFLDFVVGFIIALPFLIVWGIIITGIVLVIRAIVKASAKKSVKRREEYQQKMMAQNQQPQMQGQQAAKNQQAVQGQQPAVKTEEKK